MKIDSETISALENVRLEGNLLFLEGHLDRKLYQKVDKVLQAAGGKWNRKQKAHTFESNPEDVLDQIITMQEVTIPQDFGYFPTPQEVVLKLIDLADIKPGYRILEPSAGRGNIAAYINDNLDVSAIHCVELLADNVKHLRGVITKGKVLQGDFLTLSPKPSFDRVVMNPPFERHADINHVLHAYQFLKSTGLLISVMSAGVTFRSDRKTTGFREFVETQGGWIDELPDGSFKESGTMVRTCVVVIPGVRYADSVSKNDL